MNKSHFHCSIVDAEKCKGCTNCVKGCPTEAIRVRGGTAITLEDRCIDCGNCVRICPYHAKIAITDPLDLNRLREFKTTIALLSPVIYSQFHRLVAPGQVLNAVKSLGFDEVFQESIGADAYATAIKELLKAGSLKKPVISSVCPAVLRLIQIRFPSLIEHIAPIMSPVEIAAKLAREQVSRSRGVDEGQIGLFIITPCTAKATSIKRPIGIAKSNIDGAISLIHLYSDLYQAMAKTADDPSLTLASGQAVGWARSGGETVTINAPNYLVADGLINVISILEQTEMGHFPDIDYIECLVCHGGCVGGPLTIENPFIARIRTRNLVKQLPRACRSEAAVQAAELFRKGFFNFTEPIETRPAAALNDDIGRAIELVRLAEKLHRELPGLDCGSCGSPNCRAHAEDVARGEAKMTDCVFKLFETIQTSAERMLELINQKVVQEKNQNTVCPNK